MGGNPEATKLYLIERPTKEQVNMFKLAHGHFVNYDNPKNVDAALDRLSVLVQKLDPIYSSEGESRTPPNVICKGNLRVVVSGFAM